MKRILDSTELISIDFETSYRPIPANPTEQIIYLRANKDPLVKFAEEKIKQGDITWVSEHFYRIVIENGILSVLFPSSAMNYLHPEKNRHSQKMRYADFDVIGTNFGVDGKPLANYGKYKPTMDEKARIQRIARVAPDFTEELIKYPVAPKEALPTLTGTITNTTDTTSSSQLPSEEGFKWSSPKRPKIWRVKTEEEFKRDGNWNVDRNTPTLWRQVHLPLLGQQIPVELQEECTKGETVTLYWVDPTTEEVNRMYLTAQERIDAPLGILDKMRLNYRPIFLREDAVSTHPETGLLAETRKLRDNSEKVHSQGIDLNKLDISTFPTSKDFTRLLYPGTGNPDEDAIVPPEVLPMKNITIN